MISRAENEKLFNSIAGRYDLLNSLLSFHQDFFWRRELVGLAGQSRPQEILDLATGSGKVAIELALRLPEARITGIDIAEEMLKVGRQKIKQLGLESQVKLQYGDLLQLPFADRSFNLVTIAFALRNLDDPKIALQEMRRVLKPEGRLLILELSLPDNPLICFFFLLYLRTLLFLLGALVSAQPAAYKYLADSIVTFSRRVNLLELMQEAGFSQIGFRRLTFGVVRLYYGR